MIQPQLLIRPVKVKPQTLPLLPSSFDVLAFSLPSAQITGHTKYFSTVHLVAVLTEEL